MTSCASIWPRRWINWSPKACPSDDARREAERQFGDLSVVQEMGERLGHDRERNAQRRDYWGSLLQDLRYAFRTLRRDRAFTIITVVILALGIAANTTVFSVVNTVLLRPLPFPDSQQLVWLEAGKEFNAGLREAIGLSGQTYTVSAFEEFQRHNQSFQEVTSYDPFFANGDFTMTGKGEPQPVLGVLVAGNFFQTLGVQPLLGRQFVEEECRKGGRPAALLGYALWQRQFAGDPNIVGQAIVLRQETSDGGRRAAFQLRFRLRVFTRPEGGSLRSGHHG